MVVRRILPVSVVNALARNRLKVVSDGEVADILGLAAPQDPEARLEKEIIERGGRYWFRMLDDWPSLPAMRESALERLRIAEWVLVPTPQLAEACQEDIPGIRVHAYEEAVDTGRIQERTAWENRDLPIVVWTGNPRNLKHLDLLKEPLSRAYQRVPFELHVVSKQQPKVSWNLPVKWTPYDANQETKNLSSAAVGLAITPNDRFHRAKGMYKLKTYLAAGIPALAPDYGFFSNLIREEETGFLCRSDNDWVDRLCLLLEDRTLNRKMGHRAREWACQRYSFEQLAPKWVCAIREMVAGRQPESVY